MKRRSFCRNIWWIDEWSYVESDQTYWYVWSAVKVKTFLWNLFFVLFCFVFFVGNFTLRNNSVTVRLVKCPQCSAQWIYYIFVTRSFVYFHCSWKVTKNVVMSLKKKKNLFFCTVGIDGFEKVGKPKKQNKTIKSDLKCCQQQHLKPAPVMNSAS